MDCWSSPLPLHDEFEKLVIRMNPPRWVLLLLICTAGWCLCSGTVVLHVVFLLPCRVTVDNVSSRTDTVIKVLNSPLVGLVFSALQKGLSVTVFCCRLIARTGAGVCWRWFRFSLTWISVLEELTFPLMENGSWMVRCSQFSICHVSVNCVFSSWDIVLCGFLSLASFSCHGSKWEKVWARWCSWPYSTGSRSVELIWDHFYSHFFVIF